MSRAGPALAADDLVQRAERLLARWHALSARHITLGAGCGCGIGGVSLRLEDFELDIVDYLGDAGSRCSAPEVAAFFTELQRRAEDGAAMGGRARPLQQLLEQARQGRLPDAVTAWLLPQVERTLQSYDALHGPRLDG